MTNRPLHSKIKEWRTAYDVTESQARAMAALMAAQRLGYDGATIKEMRLIGLTRTQAETVHQLRHRGLVDVAGPSELPHELVYRATDKAFRRFGVKRVAEQGANG